MPNRHIGTLCRIVVDDVITSALTKCVVDARQIHEKLFHSLLLKSSLCEMAEGAAAVFSRMAKSLVDVPSTPVIEEFVALCTTCCLQILNRIESLPLNSIHTAINARIMWASAKNDESWRFGTKVARLSELMTNAVTIAIWQTVSKIITTEYSSDIVSIVDAFMMTGDDGMLIQNVKKHLLLWNLGKQMRTCRCLLNRRRRYIQRQTPTIAHIASTRDKFLASTIWTATGLLLAWPTETSLDDYTSRLVLIHHRWIFLSTDTQRLMIQRLMDSMTHDAAVARGGEGEEVTKATSVAIKMPPK